MTRNLLAEPDVEPAPETNTPAGDDPPRDREGRVLLHGLSRAQLASALELDAADTERVWRALYRELTPDLARVPGLSPARARDLRARARVDALTLAEVRESPDGTRKLLLDTDAGARVEAVLIPGARRTTICISSQVGCAMNCQFCLTAKMGLRGNLATAELIAQVVIARRRFRDMPPIGNVVFMGMGEPLHNVERVIAATRILVDQRGLDLGARRVTVSTSGLVPAIERFGRESPAQLAVSLNATTDEVRDWLMPVNRRYPLARLLACLRAFPLRPRERITLEYVLLAGVNDSLADAARIHDMTQGIACKVNLIPFNEHPGTEFRRPDERVVLAFRDALRERGVSTSVRRTRGDETMAACGQLGRPGPRPPRRTVPPARLKPRA
ncbi:MAG: 23S rRNA (adenine(2503)-C(2))-methyltransferase RlmN [Myxococcales bacterium]|nr:23S rRNA (adenine(2503)-C(2))-methyltransferase RlmN [Myxococcales bacterium]MCB9754836.1 23S rRNA (adenine(2503)-C(2))-methyltransferase RlmN [Myxococcales bacterium]